MSEAQQQQKHVYVSDLRPNMGDIREWFLVTRMDQKQSGRGPFLIFEFADKTGVVPGIMWDASFATEAFRVDDIIKVRGFVGEYNHRPQIVVDATFKPADPSIAPPLEHFFRLSKEDPLAMWKDVLEIADHWTTGDINWLMEFILNDDKIKPLLLRAPAAMSMHHAYIGGLLEHIRGLMHKAVALRGVMEFDLPVVLAACLLHDIGKCFELSFERSIRYSTLGMLHGHIMMGFSLVDRLCDGDHINPKIAAEVLHVIASHHGTKEHGSPVVPATREAIVFHALDKLDANLASFEAALEQPSDEDDDWTPYCKALGTRFMRPRRPDITNPMMDAQASTSE